MRAKHTKGLKLKAHRLTKISDIDRMFMAKAIDRAINSIKAFKNGDSSALDRALDSLQIVERCTRSYRSSIETYRLYRNPLL